MRGKSQNRAFFCTPEALRAVNRHYARWQLDGCGWDASKANGNGPLQWAAERFAGRCPAGFSVFARETTYIG
jgi:hypothetical protein